MPFVDKLREAVIGKPHDPLNPETRTTWPWSLFWPGSAWAPTAVLRLLRPEEAFLALGQYTHFGLYLAAATFLTVFVIALAYNQVIELFPSGGGGYKVATQLLGSKAGLVSGSALLVDYVLTIAISIAAGVDALFSLLPPGAQPYKLTTEMALIIVLIVLNLRGMKESIKVLLPIFLGFFLTHTFLILYGVAAHAEGLPRLIPDTITETRQLTEQMGWVFAISLFLRAYSLGGGTYTGLEAVSNNVNMLSEPRVRTGTYTMFYMAGSLSFTAGGIILLYLLWNVQHVPHQTLNAVTFGAIIASWQLDPTLSHGLLAVVLLLEGGLLFVAANTGFLGGPTVLANMAVDSWVPRQFRNLSGRLVTQNGIFLMGLGALGILIWTNGDVSVLVVLYSINVFITFSLSLLGLCRHWWESRYDEANWKARLLLSLLGFMVTGGILIVTVVEKFTEGGWLTHPDHRPAHRDLRPGQAPLRTGPPAVAHHRRALRAPAGLGRGSAGTAAAPGTADRHLPGRQESGLGHVRAQVAERGVSPATSRTSSSSASARWTRKATAARARCARCNTRSRIRCAITSTIATARAGGHVPRRLRHRRGSELEKLVVES
jgi:amino acid transporter